MVKILLKNDLDSRVDQIFGEGIQVIKIDLYVKSMFEGKLKAKYYLDLKKMEEAFHNGNLKTKN